MSVSGRILFVSAHPPGRVPGQRFRFEQYVGFLEDHGFQTTFSPVIRPKDYDAMYRRGGAARKGLVQGRGLLLRLCQIVSARRYDIIFVQREATQLGTAAFESAMGLSSARVLFDFDDAIWMHESSEANRRMAWLKRPKKVSSIIALSDMVFAGNDYLAKYARDFNSNVHVVPTTIDTDSYLPIDHADDDRPVCIGWSGSITTIKHFTEALPALRSIKRQYRDRVRFKVIGDPSFRCDELGITGQAWRSETEVNDLSDLDIGLMPLPDSPWTRGKCGLKGLQYMALGIPPVMAPVGVNCNIIDHGVNGYLASTEDEWIDRIAELVESRELRASLGAAARRTVVERYSVTSQKDRYLRFLEELMSHGQDANPAARD